VEAGRLHSLAAWSMCKPKNGEAMRMTTVPVLAKLLYHSEGLPSTKKAISTSIRCYVRQDPYF
jgi:hypothetical protein